MATIHDLLVKFNIPEDERFEFWYSRGINNKLLDGELIVDENRYTIKYENLRFTFDLNNGFIEDIYIIPGKVKDGGYILDPDGGIAKIN